MLPVELGEAVAHGHRQGRRDADGTRFDVAPVDAQRAVGAEPGDQLANEERAASRLLQQSPQRIPRWRTHLRGDEISDLGVGQRPDGQLHAPRRRDTRDEPRHISGTRRRAHRQHDHETLLRRDPAHAGDQRKRRRIDPLHVVDDDGDRPTRAQLVDQAEDLLADPEPARLISTSDLGVEPGRHPRPPGVLHAGAHAQRVEEDAEGATLLELVRRRRVHRQSQVARRAREQLDEVGLADSRLTDDDCRRASPVDGPPSGSRQRRQLGLATDHPASIRGSARWRMSSIAAVGDNPFVHASASMPAPPPSRAVDEQRVVETLITVATACATFNADALQTAYTSDADWISADGTALHGRDSIIDHVRQRFADPHLDEGPLSGPPRLSLRWLDDDAVIATIYAERRELPTIDGGPFSRRRTRSLKVLTRCGPDSWLIVSDITANARADDSAERSVIVDAAAGPPDR